MNSSQARSRATVLAGLIVALAVPLVARAQSRASGPSAAERARLARAADDPSLQPWQRDFMRDLARGGDGNPSAAAPAPAAAEHVAAVDGTWDELVIAQRYGHCAAYDPVRDAMVVFGGVDSVYRYLNDTWLLLLAGTPVWNRLSPSGTLPTPRQDASMIYDRDRDRIVIFGGRAGSSPYFLGDAWALPLGNNSSWSRLNPTGSCPHPRYGHSAIYDPVGGRMVVFGGYDSTYALRNDVWALSFSGTPAWTQLAPSGTPPEARWEHQAIHDPRRARMLIQGGTSSGGYLSDVWAMSLGSPAWTQLAPTGTAPYVHSGQSAVYDPVRDQMLVVCGSGAGNWYAYVWALSLAGTPNWTVTAVSAPMPGARMEQATIYDPVRDRLVVCGGETDQAGARNDVWAFPLGVTPQWTELAPSGSEPDGRNFASAICDSLRGRMVVFGGAATSYGRRNDLCALSLTGHAVWSAIDPTGSPPSARYGHSAIYDPVRDRMVVFGGNVSAAPGYSNEVWSLTLAGTPAWAQLAPGGTPPLPRAYHDAVYDPVRDRMLVYGGYGTDGVMNYHFSDVWALPFASLTWGQLAPTGGPPPTRQLASAIYDPVRDRLIVFGGEHGTRYNDTWSLALGGTPAWTQLTPGGTPPTARSGQSAIYDRVHDRMVMCGGIPGGTGAETWELSLTATPAWTQLAPVGPLPDTRGVHTCVYDAPRDRMIVFGGSNMRNDVWGLRWTAFAGVGESPAARVAYLSPPAPNPSRGTASVTFTIPRAGRVRLEVYDVSGRLVRTLLDAEREAGTATVRWDGADVAGARVKAGVYFVRLAAPGVRRARKVVVE